MAPEARWTLLTDAAKGVVTLPSTGMKKISVMPNLRVIAQTIIYTTQYPSDGHKVMPLYKLASGRPIVGENTLHTAVGEELPAFRKDLNMGAPASVYDNLDAVLQPLHTMMSKPQDLAEEHEKAKKIMDFRRRNGLRARPRDLLGPSVRELITDFANLEEGDSSYVGCIKSWPDIVDPSMPIPAVEQVTVPDSDDDDADTDKSMGAASSRTDASMGRTKPPGVDLRKIGITADGIQRPATDPATPGADVVF